MVYIVFCIGNAVLLYFASLKFFLVLQLSNYNGKKYYKWLKNKENPYVSRLMLLSMLGFLFFCVLSTCLSAVSTAIFGEATGYTVGSYLGFISYFLFTGLYIHTERRVNAKVSLKKTKRIIRLSVCYSALLIVSSFIFVIFCDTITYFIGSNVVGLLRYALICFMPLVLPHVLYFASIIMRPFENRINKKYVDGAKNKLKDSNVIKIGITGSFGKTTVKEILSTILSQKYRVLSTPYSYNTPLGIALTTKNLDSTHDIFIAEMGARSKGDIKELAEIVKPNIAVITGINGQHLESFGDLETIKDTKYELVESLSDKGVAFFSADNEGSRELYGRFNGEKYFAGISDENAFSFATDVKTTAQGTTFLLHIGKEKPIACSTILLGKHSIGNVCLASAVAYKLGLDVKEIANGINRIKTVGHRLELLPNNKNVIIIDDSYNSNIDGFNSAMEVLDMFSGRKIVLTPGLVELGTMENVMNFKVGKILASHADKVIVVGKHNAEMIVNGLIEGGMNKDDIIFEKNPNRGNRELNEIIKDGDVILFENDLPDNYN
ncbi:MAG: hypothetical protein IJR66_04595 [Clostridia bacterium]|nr:hypothetical protein [Clostridia bacterium]